jgi:hypothetical protein
MASRSSSYTSTPSRTRLEASKSSPHETTKDNSLAQWSEPDHDRRMLYPSFGRFPTAPLFGGLRLPLPPCYLSTHDACLERHSPSSCASCTTSIASLDTKAPTRPLRELLNSRQLIHLWLPFEGESGAFYDSCSQASAISPSDKP